MAQAEAGRVVTVAGGDLFRWAAVYLGDATQAYRIAELNGLVDFALSGLVTLRLPAVDAALSGGVPPQ